MLETRRRADLDVHMSDATRPMWVADGNVPSANCGNDQYVITYSVVCLLFVSFQQLRFVLRATTSNRVLKAWACGRHAFVECTSKQYQFRAAFCVSQHLLRLSNCPEKLIRVALGPESWAVITRTDASCTTPHQRLDPNTLNKLHVKSFLLQRLSAFRSVLAILRGLVAFGLKKNDKRKRVWQTGPYS